MKNSNQSLHVNTELCVDVKTYTIKNGRMQPGEILTGSFFRTDEDHFTFVEKALEGKGQDVLSYMSSAATMSTWSNSRTEDCFSPSVRLAQKRETVQGLSRAKLAWVCRTAAWIIQLLRDAC